MTQSPVSTTPRNYPIFTVFFLGALAAMQFIRR